MEKSLNKISIDNELPQFVVSVKNILLFQIISFWSVWYWYILRVTDKSDEPLGILSLITSIFFIGKIDFYKKFSNKQLHILILSLLIYILTYNFTSDMIHAVFAILSIGYTFYSSKERISPAILGLFFLTLPIIASMQFYLGYPLRMVSSYFMIILLRMNGLFVIQEGTCLSLNKRIVCVDAPCSGVNMLWFSFYFTFFICCLYKLDLKKTIIVSAISFISIIIANIMRSTSLFYVESNIINLPNFAHQGIGVITFVLSILLVFIYVNLSEKKCKI
jgi:exosortase/archaeosortase family protein